MSIKSIQSLVFDATAAATGAGTLVHAQHTR
jgi:hypothetical protein